MRICSRVSKVGALLLAFVTTGLVTPLTVYATQNDWGINGVYRATSNGEWATVNDVYHDEATVISTWTIATECEAPDQCDGSVTSDAGWTAPIYTTNGMWYVKRTVAQWQSCPDGTTADGSQVYTFYPVDELGQVLAGSPTLVGQDTTIGRSGACGVNQWRAIRLPFKLAKIG